MAILGWNMKIHLLFQRYQRFVCNALLLYFIVTVPIGIFLVIDKDIVERVDQKITEFRNKSKRQEFRSLTAFDAGVIGNLVEMKTYDWSSIKDIPKTQQNIRKEFVLRLGRKLAYKKTPEVSIHSSQQLDHGIQRIIFSVPAEPGYFIKGCMLVPSSEGPLGGIMLAYGLGGSLYQTCGWGIESYHNDMGMAMAREGYISIIPVFRGLGGDGSDWGNPEWGPMDYKDFVGYTLQQESSAMSVWVYDSLQVLTAIRKYPKIDPNNIFFGGISHGGQIALYAAALEPELIRGVLAMGSFVSYQSLYTDTHNWTGHAIPGIWTVGNMGDLAALLAPRPFLVQWGELDSKAPWASLRPSSIEEFERVQVVYEKMGNPQNIQKVITPNVGHVFDVQAAASFMAKHSQKKL